MRSKCVFNCFPTFMCFLQLGFLPRYTCDQVTMNLLPFQAIDTTQQEKACVLDREEYEKHTSYKKRLTCSNKHLPLYREVYLETTNL